MNISPEGLKYIGMNRSGIAALRSGKIEEFKGFSDSLANRFVIALTFSPSSLTRVGRLTQAIRMGIERGMGIKMIIADIDFPLHSTVMEGFEAPQSVEARKQIFSSLSENESLRQLASALEGQFIEYKYLLLDKGNIILTAIDIPDFILETRRELEGIYMEAGLKPALLDNLLHISLARMIHIPESAKENGFSEYIKFMQFLRHTISHRPLSLQVGRVLCQPTLDLLRTNPYLVK